MNAEERMFVLRLFADKPALEAAVTWAKRLTKLLRRKAVESLDDVLAAAAGSGSEARLRRSRRRLLQSNPPVDGNVCLGKKYCLCY
jgi:hypothetical protein